MEEVIVQGDRSCSQEEMVRYRCRSCSMYEEIPLNVVLEFHLLDPGDPSVPPRFSCERCGGEIWPEQDWETLRYRIDPDDYNESLEEGEDASSRPNDKFVKGDDVPF